MTKASIPTLLFFRFWIRTKKPFLSLFSIFSFFKKWKGNTVKEKIYLKKSKKLSIYRHLAFRKNKDNKLISIHSRPIMMEHKPITLKMTVQFIPVAMTKWEHNPVLRFYTSGQRLPRTKYTEISVGTAYDNKKKQVKVLLDPCWKNEEESFSYTECLPADAALWIQAYAQIESSEKRLLYEKDGSGMVYLKEFIDSKQNVDLGRELIEHKGAITRTIELRLQSLAPFAGKDGPLIKSQVKITMHTTFSKEVFRESCLTDYIGENVDLTNALIRASVNKSMVIYDDERVSQITGGKIFTPTRKEMVHVMAPYYISAAGVLPGPLYWMNMSQERPWDEKIYFDTISSVLHRNQISNHKAFARRLMRETESMEDMDFLVKACNIMGQVVAAPSATVHYIADKRVIPWKEGKVYHNRKIPKMRIVEDFGKLGPDLVEAGGDCEDSGNFNGRMFVGLRDQKMTHDITIAMQQLARKYAACGNLMTVTARNVSDSEKVNESISSEYLPISSQKTFHDDIANVIGMRVGDNDDMKMKPGAHEQLRLTPIALVLTQAKRVSEGKVFWSDGRSIDDFHPRDIELPEMDAEGTGMKNPFSLPWEAYYSSKDKKTTAVDKQYALLDAMCRVQTGRKYVEMSNGASSINRYSEKFECIGQFMRMSKNLINDPDLRLDFYRTQRSHMFLLEKDDPIYRKLFHKMQYNPVKTISADFDDIHMTKMIGNKNSSKSGEASTDKLDMPVKLPPLYWLDVTPVQIGTRPKRYKQMDENTFVAEGPRSYGVHCIDSRNKRKFVGLERSPAPSSTELLAMYTISKHLPPITPMKAMSEEEHRFLDKTLLPEINARLNKQLDNYDKGHVRPIDSSNTQIVPFFVRTSDYDPDTADLIGKWAGENQHILYVSANAEKYAHRLSVIRFDYLVDMRQRMHANPDKIVFIKDTRC